MKPFHPTRLIHRRAAIAAAMLSVAAGAGATAATAQASSASSRVPRAHASAVCELASMSGVAMDRVTRALGNGRYAVRVRVRPPLACRATGRHEWVYSDLANVYRVNEIVLQGALTHTRVSRIQVSRDGLRWRTLRVRHRRGYSLRLIARRTRIGRFVRLYATRGRTSGGPARFTFVVLGTPATRPSERSVAPSAPSTSPAFTSGLTWLGTFVGSGSGISSDGRYIRASFASDHVYATNDPATGRSVATFAINDSDMAYPGAAHPRGDLFSPALFTPGADYYISIPVRIPTGLPLIHDNAQSFFQWAQVDYPGNVEPSLGLNIGAHGDAVNHYDLGFLYHWAYPWVGPAVDGKWHTAILHVHFEPDSTGFVQLWWDGVRQTFDNGAQTFYAPTLSVSPDGQYHECLDIDQYRARGSIPGTVKVDHGVPAIGTSFAAVANTVPAAMNGHA